MSLELDSFHHDSSASKITVKSRSIPREDKCGSLEYKKDRGGFRGGWSNENFIFVSSKFFSTLLARLIRDEYFRICHFGLSFSFFFFFFLIFLKKKKKKESKIEWKRKIAFDKNFLSLKRYKDL